MRLTRGIGPSVIGALAAALAAAAAGCPIDDAKLVDTGSSSSGGGAGGAGGGDAGGGGAGGGAIECMTDKDCPATNNECVTATCIGGLCGTDNLDEGVATTTQVDDDCKIFVCDGAGGITSKENAIDLYDDGKQCTDDGCVGGSPTSTYKSAGTVCSEGGGKKCDGTGACVACLSNGDCNVAPDNLCNVNHECVATTCADSIKDGDETDKDCGGSCGATCGTGQICVDKGDCVDGICDGGACAAPTCDDQVKNGSEGDVDCGGVDCKPCDDGRTCAAPSDCYSLVCLSNHCKAPACDDGVKNGSETAKDCGGPSCPLCPTVLLLAGGNGNSFLGEFHPGMPWITSMPGEKVSAPPSIAIGPSGKAVGTVEYTDNPAVYAGKLRFTVWKEGTGFSAFADVGGTGTARGAFAVSGGGLAHTAFNGFDDRHYYSAYNGSVWSPVQEPIKNGGLHSSGPSTPSIVTLGNDVFVAYAGEDGNVYDQRRTGGAWELPVLHDLKGWGLLASLTPAIAALTAGPELMIVFVNQSTWQLYWTARAGGMWSKPVPIANAYSKDPISLLALPSGAALVAFKGTNAQLYTSRFSGGAWSAPEQPAGAGPMLASRPALSKGTDTSVAELAYVTMAGTVFHARLVLNNWTQPVQIGGAGLVYVALASAP